MFVRVLRDFCRRTTAVPGGENVVNRLIHVTVPLEKNRDRRSFLASVPRKDEGTEGEKFVFIDSAITKWVFFLPIHLFGVEWNSYFSVLHYAWTPFCWSLFRCVWPTKMNILLLLGKPVPTLKFYFFEERRNVSWHKYT